MKKSVLFFISTIWILSSCSSNFIDLRPTSTVTVDYYYQTDKDFADALIGVYASIRSQYNYFYCYGDLPADDSYIEFRKANYKTYFDLFTINSAEGQMNSTWQNYYQAIYRANTILEKIENLDVATIPNKNRYIGEARFNRALCYFDLLRIFGPVPAVTKVLTVEEAYQIPREPIESLYNNIIIPDLQAAESSLLASYSGSDVGKPTIGAAKALLGRIYMTMGDFQKAESKLMEVTSLGYQLEADFNDVFDYDNKRNSEYIYNIEYIEGNTTNGSSFTNEFAPASANFFTFFGLNGGGGESNNPTPVIMNLFEDHDLRKELTVGIHGGFYDNDSVFNPILATTNQTYTKKYLVPIPAGNASKADWKYIRYADVLLMLAEAMNENGKTEQAIPYLNMIRRRAGVSEYPTTMSKTETFDAIELERRLELSFEGHRWFDLIRWGKAYDVMKDYGMAEFMTVFPIPLRQIQLINDPAILPQNPGY